jgi:hypothetical protein
MRDRATLRSLDEHVVGCPLLPLVAHVVRDDVVIALELIGLVRSGRVTEVTRDALFGRYTLSARGAVFVRAGELVMRAASLDEWERCVRECWAWGRQQARVGVW